VSYHWGGAHRVVLSIQAQLDNQIHKFVKAGFVCNGDDTWITAWHKSPNGKQYIVKLGLDVSSMDWSQRSDLSLNMIDALAKVAVGIQAIGGLVWSSLMKSRLVAAWSAGLYLMEEGNPSGLSGVSEINGGNMAAGCVRLITKLSEGTGSSWINESRVSYEVEQVGLSMGLPIRIESYSCVEAPSLVESLKLTNFLLWIILPLF